ncbi:hypothetical protein GRI42_06140 [Erythrobacter gaetbuli]|uniref:Uncharacterized protein n=2 Tax=Qipengyuania gaetbuli TaxID=266952 RepID=A0A844Y0K7_9SPHN|nr:hypothetical protein [Qipengyuania gaetbuli]
MFLLDAATIDISFQLFQSSGTRSSAFLIEQKSYDCPLPTQFVTDLQGMRVAASGQPVSGRIADTVLPDIYNRDRHIKVALTGAAQPSGRLELVAKQDRGASAAGSMLDWLMSGSQPSDFAERNMGHTRCGERRLR